MVAVQLSPLTASVQNGAFLLVNGAFFGDADQRSSCTALASVEVQQLLDSTPKDRAVAKRGFASTRRAFW